MRTTYIPRPLFKKSLLATITVAVVIALISVFIPLSSVTARLATSAPVKTVLSVLPVTWQRAAEGHLTKQAPTQSELRVNRAGATVATAAAFDAPIAKIASPPDGTPVAQTQVITYTITVANDSAADETFPPNQLRVRDSIPANTTYEAGSLTILQQPGDGSTQFTCSFDGGNNRIECVNGAGGDLREFAVLKFEFKVRVNTNVQYATIISNTAHFLNEEQSGAGNITNSSNTTNHPVTAPADLTASKLSTPVVDPDGAGALAPVALPVVGPNVPPGSVNSGGYLRYDIPFGNSGPANADNTMITDQIPGNTAFVGALATGGAFVPGAQPPANPFTFSIVATKAANPNINLNCTVVGAPGSQAIYCRPEGNTGLGAPGPFLDGALPLGYSGTLTFFVKVNESVTGGTVASNPANIVTGLCPNTPSPYPPVSCAGTPDANPANNTTLPTQNIIIASSNLSVTKIVQSAVTSASNPNQTGPIGPATPPNGTVTTGTAVLPGTYLTYRITLTNNGPSDVSNIRLTDVLPSGLETPPGRALGAKFISANPVLPSGATFTCAAPTGVNPSNNPQGNGGSLVCTAPLLAANAPNNVAAIDVTVFIDPAAKASLVNTATFDATINNFNRPVSGTTTLTTPVAATSDLALTKTHTNTAGVLGGPVTAGTDFEYQVRITNNGPSAAQMVNLVDTIPAYQALKQRAQPGPPPVVPDIVIEAVPDGNGAPVFSCTPAADATLDPRASTSTITCTAAELPPNKKPDGTVNPAGTVTFRFRMRQSSLTPQPVPASYQNCVTATSMSTDPVQANNTNVCDTVNLIFLADLSGTKTAAPDPVIAGNQLTYTITANNAGPSAALNEMISDPLPVGTVFLSATPSAGGVPDAGNPAVNANGTVKFTWPGLTDVGVVRTLTIVVRVCPDFQQIRNLTDAQMCVPNMTNTATISSDTPDPNPANNTASFTSTVQAQSDLSISKADAPDPASYSTSGSPSNVTYTLTFANAGPSNASGVTITDVLPKGFTVVGTPTSTVPGTTFTITTANGITTVLANLGVLGAANQCQLARPTSGTIVIVAKVPIKHPTITVTNTATIASTNCLPETGSLAVQTNPLSGSPAIITPGTGMLANNRAFADTFIVPPGPTPGLGYPALAEVSDQKEGSVLFYPIYTSEATNANAQNTRVNITNTSSTEHVIIHLFAVDGASCAVLDVFICLTPNQTSSFLASDFDPGNTGYMMAVAVESGTGLPRVFNELIGDLYVKFASGHAANLAAESIAASMMFPAGLNATATTATLRFDGMNYNRLPRVVAASNIGSRADGNSTMLIVNRVGGDLSASGALIGGMNGLLYDDAENSYSFTANAASCQFRRVLDNNFPRTFTPFDRVLPSGRYGWLKLWTNADSALFGATINFNPNARSSAGAFSQGHNLHHMTVTDTVTVVVPLFIPSC
ncbi:MAG: hypothetical protein ACKVZH_25855 [Blastocatellia bacterium]